MVAAVALVVAVVAGCGGPGQAGAAVIVGDEVVPVEVVQARLDDALSRPGLQDELAAQGVGAPDLAREIVAGLVLRELLERAAATAGVTVTDDDVDREVDANGGVEALLAAAPYDETVLREIVRNQLISVRLGERRAAELGAVDADVVVTQSREEAEAAAQALLAGGPAADALFGGQNSRRGATVPVVAETAAWPLFGVPVGSAVVFQPSQDQAGWWAALVTGVRGPEGDAEPVPETALASLGRQAARPVAAEVGLRVNPRYGRWDPVTLGVVPDGFDTGRIFAPAAE